MGLFSGRRERRERKLQEVRREAYDKALAQGESKEDAEAAGEKAVKRYRRRRRAIIMGAANSGS